MLSDLISTINRRLSLRAILVISLLVVAGQAQVAGVQGTMPEDYLPGLKPILENAVKQAPSVISASISVAIAEAGRISADSALYPSVGGSASYGSSGSSSDSSGTTSSSTSTGLSYSLGLSQPIYQFGALKARSDVAKLSLKIAERQFADAYRLLAISLRTQYLGLIYKKMTLRNARFQLRVVEGDLAAMEAKLQARKASLGDLNGPRLAAEDARLAVERVAQDLAYSKVLFIRLAGLTDLADAAIPDDIPKPVFPSEVANNLLSAFTHEGPERSPLGETYVMAIKQSELNYKIAKTGLYPRFSATAGYSLSFSSAVVLGQVYQSAVRSRSFGLTGSMTVFDGFATRAAKLTALAVKRTSERTLASYSESMIDAAKNQHALLGIAARSMDIADAKRLLQKAAIGIISEEVKRGTKVEADVDGITATYNSYEISSTAIRMDFFNRWADFVSTTGADPALGNLPARYLTNAHGK